VVDAHEVLDVLEEARLRAEIEAENKQQKLRSVGRSRR
jgi:hypothetical protein